MAGKVPCEIITWYVLPSIRRKLATVMIDKYGMYQKDAAKFLGVTDAAISASAGKIIDGTPAEEEICRLCKFLVSVGILDKIK